MSRNLFTRVVTLLTVCGLATNAYADGLQFEFAPYFRLTSTKSVEPGAAMKSDEDTEVDQRQELGLKALLRVSSFFGMEFSYGQNTDSRKETTGTAVDEFDQINYVDDLNMDVSNPDRGVATRDEMNVIRFGTFFDPSFSIFMFRAAAGVQANQRNFKLTMEGAEPESLTTPWKYDPYATVGFGIRFSPQMYWMTEYGFHFYKFPDFEPFAREFTVSFAIAIGD